MNENMNLIPKIEEIVTYYMLSTTSLSIDYQDTMINIIV